MTDLRLAPPAGSQMSEIRSIADHSAKFVPRGRGHSIASSTPCKPLATAAGVAQAQSDRPLVAVAIEEVADRFIDTPDCVFITCLSRSTWLQLVRDGLAPQPIRLSKRCTRWSLKAVNAWVSERIAESAQ